MGVLNKRLAQRPVSAFKLIYSGCAIDSADEAHVSFKWTVVLVWAGE